MEDAEFPDTMQQALTSVETRGHPFRGTAFTRVDSAQGLPISTIAEARDADVLLWVGCGGAGRAQSQNRAVAGAAVDQGRRLVRHSGTRGKMHRRSCPANRQRVLVRAIGAREYRHARSV